MFFKTLKLLFVIIPSVLVLLLLHVLYFLDYSIQPVPALSKTEQSVSLHLISYADGEAVYRQNQNSLAASAINRGVDFIYNYRRSHIQPAFIRENPILNAQMGAGYWLWKPYLILETLKKIPEGDILIYADTGLLMRQTIRGYFEKALGDKDILLFAYDPKLYQLAGAIASGDAFAAIHCRDERCRYGHHVWAGLLVLRNSKESRSFIRQWLQLCQKEDLLTGHSPQIPSFPEFSAHQHDESLLSVLAAKQAASISFSPMDRGFFRYINMHRRKKNDHSLIGSFSVEYYGFERQLLNAPLTQQLERYLAKLLEKKPK